MKWEVGSTYRAKTGEIVSLVELTKDTVKFLARDPNTLEPTEFYLEGPVENLNGFAMDQGMEKIDLKTHIPTGLIPSEEAGRN